MFRRLPMFNRRDLLKSASALAIPAPGLLAAGEPSRAIPANPDAPTTVRLAAGHVMLDGDRYYADVHVQIFPLDVWRSLKRPINGELSDDTVHDKEWSASLADDGLSVVAVRIEWRGDLDVKDYPRDIPDPYALKALRRIRRRFTEMLEDDPKVDFFSVDVHGNGECSVTIDSPADPVKISFAMAD
jgi:hypothetical protein